MEEQLSLEINHYFQTFWAWAASLQTVDYVLIFAVLLGVAVVFLFMRADQTARIQMERELQQSMGEREAMLRKEVYLPAAEAIAQAQDFLGRLPAADVARDQLRLVAAQVAGALGKAQLVATDASMRPLVAVTAELTKSQLGLPARRQPLDRLKVELEELDRSIAHLAVERDHLLASLTRCAADTGADQNIVWHEVNARFDKSHREISSLLGQRKDRQALRSRLERELSLEAIQSALRLAKLALPAYLALRDELRLDTPESEYRIMAQRSISEIERHLQTLLEPERKHAERIVAQPEPQRPELVPPGRAEEGPKLKMVLKNLSH
jgi:hypothetical protein